MSILYRPATSIDAYNLACLDKQYFEFPHSEEQFIFEINDKCHHIYLASDNNKVVGYIGLMYVVDESYITNIIVDEAYRRMGIADQLMSLTEIYAKNVGASFISLEVRRSNCGAINLYTKHNFSIKGVIPNYYFNPNEDALVMTLEVE